jgi:hypothetical protein
MCLNTFKSQAELVAAMKEQTLMLIVDINGYTRFLTRVGHEEGLRRAQDLLQIIINSNTLGLKLCEVEGDAVFFYAMKQLPSRNMLMRQISRTYEAFNHYLAVHRLDTELGIKFFMHSGMCEEVRIGGRTKLYGMEVIEIHRLLKSITNKDDHMLVTASAAEVLEFQTEEGVSREAEFPYIGAVNYTLYNKQFLKSSVNETSVYKSFLHGFSEAIIILTGELSNQYRRYAAVMNPLHEVVA